MVNDGCSGLTEEEERNDREKNDDARQSIPLESHPSSLFLSLSMVISPSREREGKIVWSRARLTKYNKIVLAENGLRFERLTKIGRRIMTIDMEQFQRAPLAGQIRSKVSLECFRNFAVDSDNQIVIVGTRLLPLNDVFLGGKVAWQLTAELDVLALGHCHVLQTEEREG